MPVEYLSVEQEARYGRFAAEPSPGELEQFFRLDSEALGRARARRRPATRLGWAVQWGTASAAQKLAAHITISQVPRCPVSGQARRACRPRW
jgi:hypothetical protein